MKGLPASRRRRMRLAGIALILLVMMMALPTAYAAAPPPPQDSVPTSPGGRGDDGGTLEVGAEAAGGDLGAYACSESTYLTNRLASCGWIKRYNWCYGNAWEEDFKKTSAGGTEPYYLDSVDLAFYVGHGSAGSFTFDSTHDDYWLTPADCSWTWGTYDNDWVALTSCQVLSGDPTPWATCMNGTHLVLGFVSNAAANMGTWTQGYQFANYLCYGWTMTAAWFKACDISQPAGRVVRVLAEEPSCFNDRPAASSSCSESTFNMSNYWWMNHTCGSPEPRPLKEAILPRVMPVFRTPPLSLAEAQTESTHLGGVFSVTAPGTRENGLAAAECVPGQTWRSVTSDGRELEMDCTSGLFNYYDPEMWSGQAAQAALAPKTAAMLTPQDARGIADAFLNENGLMPGDARYLEVVADTTAGGGRGNAANAQMVEQPLVYQVIYERIVSSPVANGPGMAPTVTEWQVLGPGAKLKVYVPTTAQPNGVTAALPVLGTVGGWRSVSQPTGAQPSAVETIPVLTEAQILKLQGDATLIPMVALNTPPIDATSNSVLATTLGYWEQGVTVNQSELIPVYALTVKYMKDQQDLGSDFLYIPANQKYMRPYAKISSIPAGTVRVGQEVQLEAVDASTMLSELGFDSSLNFALGTGPYIYDWFLGGVAPENKIGSGRTMKYTVMSDVDVKSQDITQQIILRVTDAGSSDLLSTTDSALLNVGPRITVPLILKQW